MLNIFALVINIFDRLANTILLYYFCERRKFMKLNKNIYNLRKKKGFSQEYIAEQINVSRQTISNWELGETSPNPEQLLLLSKILETSIDNLLGNEKSFKDSNDKHNYIYLGLMIICGGIVGIWSYTANRFNISEIVLIIIGGIIIGYGIGLFINGTLKKVEKNKEDKPEVNSKKEDMNKLMPLICKCITIAMGISVVVLNILDELKIKDSISMLGIGLFCIGLSLLSKQK